MFIPSGGTYSADEVDVTVVKQNGSVVVDTTQNQTVDGVKTFGSFPVTPSSAPTANYEVSNKKYVDDKSLTIASTAEAQAGTDNTKAISSLRLREGLNATGTAPIYACRAWVNFNGTGTVAIRASGNVSSITDNGVGDYTVNFTTAMVDGNYCSSIGQLASIANPSNQYIQLTTKTTSSLRVYTVRDSAANDAQEVSISIFR